MTPSKEHLPKILMLLIGIILHYEACSQNRIIDVTENKFSYLFFESNVTDAQIGSAALVIEIKNKRVGVFAEQIPFTETSLLVDTEDGESYYFLVRYNASPVRLTHAISPADLVHKDKGALVAEKEETSYFSESEAYQFNDAFDISASTRDSICLNVEALIKKPGTVRGVGKIGKTSSVMLDNIGYDGQFLYFKFSLENTANIDYHLDFAQFFIEDRKSLKRKTAQEEILTPLLIYEPVKIFGRDEIHQMIYVFEKFTITNQKHIRAEFWEAEGDRKTLVKVASSFVLAAEIL